MKRWHKQVRTGLILALTLALVAPMVLATDDPEVELGRMAELYRAITSYHTLLQGEAVSEQMVHSALYDVEHYVSEIDSRFATDQLFIKDPRIMQELTEVVAKAHFQVALLHARGVDLEASITEYEKVIDLLGYDPADWDQKIERTAHRGLLSNASEIVYQVTTPREAVEDLKHFWSAGVVTRFQVDEYSSAQIKGLQLERSGGRNDAFSEAAFKLADARFRERLQAGLEDFRVVLPPGRYRVYSSEPGNRPMEFHLLQGGVPDPIVLNPNSFSFALTNEDPNCTPAFYLNGLQVKNLIDLPFGTYRIKTSRECKRRLPDKISVIQKGEVTLRTEPERMDLVREGQPIFLFITTPASSTYNLRF